MKTDKLLWSGVEKKSLEGILRFLKENSGEATEPEITRAMLPISPSTTQKRIDKLERLGYARREKTIAGRRVDINNVLLVVVAPRGGGKNEKTTESDAV